MSCGLVANIEDSANGLRLVRFLTKSAHETAARARTIPDAVRTQRTLEVAELMVLRARILGRRQSEEQTNQLQLPLADAA